VLNGQQHGWVSSMSLQDGRLTERVGNTIGRHLETGFGHAA